MTDAVFELRVFHYLLLPILLLALCRWWFGPLGRLSFPAAFTVAWLLLVHAQALEIYLSEYRLTTFLYSVWATPFIVLFTAGPVAARLGHRVPTLHQTQPRGSTARDAGIARLAPLATGFLFALIAVYIVDIGVRNVALFFLFASPGSALDGMILRVNGLESHISPLLTILYSYSRALLFPVYAAVATSLWLVGRLRRAHWLAIVGGAACFSVLTAAKAPLAFTLAGVLLAAYLTRPGAVGLGKLTTLFAVALFIPALIYPLIRGSSGGEVLTVAVENLWRRMTYVTSVTGAMHFDAFPATHGFAGFGSNRVLATITGTPSVATSEWMFDRYMPGQIHGGTANTAFFASFYADFGVAGVVGGAIVVGLCLLGLQLFFDRSRPRDALAIGCHAATMIAAMQMMMTNFYSVALGRGMLALPIALWAANVLSRHRGSRLSPATLPYAPAGPVSDA